MANLQTISELDLSGKRVLMRVDFNLPLDDQRRVANDRRIRAALPTIRYALDKGGRLILVSHMGRPNGEYDERFSLRPVVEHLEGLLEGHPIRFVESIEQWSPDDQRENEIVVLENLRFHHGETQVDEAFARRLASFADVYVNDAFANCHRKHTSMFAVPLLFDEANRAIGKLVQRELAALDDLLDQPQSPVVAVLGGAKVADKLGAVESLLQVADSLLIGGAMAYTFLQADGGHIGASHVEAEYLDSAKRLLDEYREEIILPVDHVIAREFQDDLQIEMADGGMPPEWAGMDIGPKTIGRFSELVREAGTVLWNGPLGMFEDESFSRGTESIARAVAAAEGTTVVGGGETGQVVEQMELEDMIDHVSTGGGAFLKYVQDRDLPALSAIPQAATTR